MCITQTEEEDAEAQGAICRGIDAYNDAVSGRPEPEYAAGDVLRRVRPDG